MIALSLQCLGSRSRYLCCRRAGLENELKKSADFYLTCLIFHLIWRSDVDGHYDYFNGRCGYRANPEQEQGEGWLIAFTLRIEICLHIYNEVLRRTCLLQFRLRHMMGNTVIRGEGSPI